MSKGLKIKPNKWAQFDHEALQALVQRKYPDFGAMQIAAMPRYSLIELLEIKSNPSDNASHANPRR